MKRLLVTVLTALSVLVACGPSVDVAPDEVAATQQPLLGCPEGLDRYHCYGVEQGTGDQLDRYACGESCVEAAGNAVNAWLLISPPVFVEAYSVYNPFTEECNCDADNSVVDVSGDPEKRHYMWRCNARGKKIDQLLPTVLEWTGWGQNHGEAITKSLQAWVNSGVLVVTIEQHTCRVMGMF